MEVSKSEGDLDNEKFGGVFWEAPHFLQMAEKLSTLYKLHQEIDAELCLKHILHVNQERVVHLEQYVLLHFEISHVVELNYKIFADGLHRIENLGSLVLDQEYLAKTSLTDLFLDVEVIQRGILVFFLLEHRSGFVSH